jgi:hypothetical protein
LPRRTPGPFGEATGGFRAGPTGQQAEYDGVVFAFADEAEARAALTQLRINPLTKEAMDRHPGISVMFLDRTGQWNRSP